MNVMVSLINKKKIKTEAELKKVYHKLILQKHPDVNSSKTSQEEFITLQNWYFEAKQVLSVQSTEKIDEPKMETILDTFYELVSLNYPFGSINHQNFTQRVAVINDYYSRNSQSDYNEVEKEFSKLIKSDVFYVSAHSIIRNYLYLLQSYYYNGFKHIKGTIEKEKKIIDDLLEKKEMSAVKNFLFWLYTSTMEIKGQ